TQFNGVNVLAKDGSMKIQVGANDGQTISIDLQQIDSSTLGLNGFAVSKNSLNVGEALTQVGDGSGGMKDINLSAVATSLKLSSTDGLTLHNINGSSNYVVQSGSDYYSASVGKDGVVALNTTTVEYTDAANGITATASQAGQLVKVGADANGNSVAYVNVNGKNYISAAGTGGTADTDPLANKMAGADSTGTAATDTTQSTTTLVLDGNTGASAQFAGASTADPLALLDKAIASVDKFRSSLGAVQNRLSSAVTNLNNTTTNLSEAQSRIQDADYATEVSNMSKAQIIQQAGNSVLSKANQVPQQVLSLLQG
ncbi:flagellin, partial [Enterobacter hormaechei]